MALNHGVFAAQNDEPTVLHWLRWARFRCCRPSVEHPRSGPIKLVAMADAFEDRFEGSLNNLARKHGDRVDVPEDSLLRF